MSCQPQELRRAVASKAGMESDAREHANRAKRLQREVEMMRSEYEVISEETSSLRGSLAGAEVGLGEDLEFSEQRLLPTSTYTPWGDDPQAILYVLVPVCMWLMD